MKVARKVLLIGALAALATVVFGGAPSVATGQILHPCWDIDKSASVSGTPVTGLTLTLGQTVQVDYAVAVTKRECRAGEDPNDSVDVFDSYLGVSGPLLPPGTLALHLEDSQTFRYSRNITAETCDPFEVENTARVVDTVELDRDTVTIEVEVVCDRVSASCTETTNPHGQTVPPAGSTTLPGPRGGQNEDGFYLISGTTSGTGSVQVFVVDTGSGTVFGPYPSGTKIKYTEANGATPNEKKIGSTNGQAGAVLVHITGTGDAAVYAVSNGVQSPLVFCLVPPPPK